MTVATNHSGYPENRNIINLPYNKVTVRKVTDIFKLFTHIYFKLLNKSHHLTLNSFCDFGLNKSDINHFFNGISFCNRPWVTTFETLLPRYGNASKFWYKYAVKRLAHNSCKALIALSENAKQIQINYLKDNYPQYLDSISRKLIVLHPAQDVIADNKQNIKNNYSKIVFTLIGNQFFSKGGRESYNVIKKLNDEKYNLELNIVSGMDTDNYASNTNIKDVEFWLPKLKNTPGIIFHGRLSSEEVKKLYLRSDVILLPTYADTYGYSVLEAQAAGCPVISTNIRALPEINNNEAGWIIEVPKDKNGNAILKTPEDRKELSSIIEQELYRIIKDEIIPNPEIIKKKGEKALQRIRQHHNPNDKAQFLENLYKKCL